MKRFATRFSVVCVGILLASASAGAGGNGRVEFTVKSESKTPADFEDKLVAFDLPEGFKEAGATFDRFGIMNVRKGGKYVTMYLDDLEYTARRPADYKPVRHEQKTTTVPYPPDGRLY